MTRSMLSGVFGLLLSTVAAVSPSSAIAADHGGGHAGGFSGGGHSSMGGFGGHAGGFSGDGHAMGGVIAGGHAGLPGNFRGPGRAGFSSGSQGLGHTGLPGEFRGPGHPGFSSNLHNGGRVGFQSGGHDGHPGFPGGVHGFDHGGFSSRFHGHDYAHFTAADHRLWDGGHWSHDWHSGRYGWWWIADGGWYLYSTPIYPYPTYVSPAIMGGMQNWYCDNPQGYYPYVANCIGRWHGVPPAPVPQAPAAYPPPPTPAG